MTVDCEFSTLLTIVRALLCVYIRILIYMMHNVFFKFNFVFHIINSLICFMCFYIQVLSNVIPLIRVGFWFCCLFFCFVFCCFVFFCCFFFLVVFLRGGLSKINP